MRVNFICLILAVFFLLAGCNTNEKPANNAVVETEKIVLLSDLVKGDIVKIADGMQFLEGPVWDSKNQRLIFSDVAANKHLQWSKDLGVGEFRSPSNFAGGNTFDSEGAMIVCEGGTRAVSRISSDGARVILVDRFKEKKLNSPNDVIISRDGAIWFTDPTYGLQGRAKEQDENRVYRYSLKTGTLEAVISTMSMPNGLAFSPDESLLYVGNSAEDDRYIMAFQVRPKGKLDNGRRFAEIESRRWGADGVKVDELGNVYAACGDGINIFRPDGSLIGKIPTDTDVTNLVFGGRSGKTLFFTGHSALFSIEMNVRGT